MEQEGADDEHPFGRSFQRLGRTFWYAGAGDFERVIRDIPQVFADAKALQRTWMVPWADNLLALAIVACNPEGTSEATLRAAVEAAGGRLTDDGLVAAQLLAGDPEASLAECARRLPELEADGQTRAYWTTEELRIRALLALGRFTDVRDAVDAARACRNARLEVTVAVARPTRPRWRLGDEQEAVELRTAVDLLMAVAGTLNDTSARSRFLYQRIAAKLLV